MADITYEDIWQVLDANIIWGTLWQGSAPPGGNVLREKGFDVLVLAAKDHQRADMYPGVTVICAPGDDDARRHRLDRFIDGWREAARQVVEHVRAGRNVLVTCMAGHNRSGLIVALALRDLTGWSGQEIVDHVCQSRPYALNNSTFAGYICECYPRKKDVL